MNNLLFYLGNRRSLLIDIRGRESAEWLFMSYERETEAMLSAARQAGEIALWHFRAGTAAEVKEDQSPVTAADRECEQFISGSLSAGFPADGILGEEGTHKPSHSGRRWLIDPIDGTRDFVRRNRFWSVQIALEADGRIVLGAIYFPLLAEMLHAISGVGCYWNDAPTRVADTSRLDKAILAVSGFKSAWGVWDAEALRRLTEICWTVRGYGASYDIAMLARGKADIWLSGNGMEWDYAPARIIAQESGARFLTRDGTGRIDARHCLICTPGLEQELRALLRMRG
ncbi:MAG: inositol monophosphatase [Acidobacteriia bacterium]|nr:inositol monophosphatase [Terriglobia bacterium]